ncbi:MAG: BatD family protein [Phycisphaerales bacterium]|nr:MAG: BatD family protein [Phycisphaerales bacterium]
MRGWPIVITGWVFGSVAPVVLAQQPSVELKVGTRTLELGEAVDVQLVCTNTGRPDIPQMVVPDGLDLKLLNSIPSSSSFTRIINGRASHRTTSTYTMSLIALKEGTYTLGPITVTADARTYRTKPITIVVRKTDTASIPRGDRFIYAQIEVEPRSLYVTETYTARLTIGIRKVQIGQRTFEVDWVSSLRNGPSQLSVFRKGEWNRTESRLTDSAGTRRRYEILVATSNVRAEEVGMTQVGPVFLKVDYPTAVRSSFFRGYEVSQSRKETARADAIMVEVKGPPDEGRPGDYTGALGRFTMNVTAKPTRVEQGQPVTLAVSIRGAPLEGVAAPDLTKHPELVSRFDFTTDELVGDREGRAKVFRRAIFPRQIGEQTIPAISWSYFDPREERYVTLTSEPISINVDPPSATAATISMTEQPRPESNGTTLTVLTGGISPNFIDPDAVLANQSFTVTGPWAGSLVVSPLVWLIVTLTTRHRARLKADVNFARRRRARRDAHGRVRRALRHKEPAQQMYGLAEAVTGYLSDRFGLPPATLTPGEVRSLLAAHGLEGTTAIEIVDFLETCDALRYAPSAVGNLSAAQAAGRVRGWIKRIEGGTR